MMISCRRSPKGSRQLRHSRRQPEKTFRTHDGARPAFAKGLHETDGMKGAACFVQVGLGNGRRQDIGFASSAANGSHLHGRADGSFFRGLGKQIKRHAVAVGVNEAAGWVDKPKKFANFKHFFRADFFTVLENDEAGASGVRGEDPANRRLSSAAVIESRAHQFVPNLNGIEDRDGGINPGA